MAFTHPWGYGNRAKCSNSYETTTDNEVYVMTIFPGVDYVFSASLAEDERANKGVDCSIIMLRKHQMTKAPSRCPGWHTKLD